MRSESTQKTEQFEKIRCCVGIFLGMSFQIARFYPTNTDMNTAWTKIFSNIVQNTFPSIGMYTTFTLVAHQNNSPYCDNSGDMLLMCFFDFFFPVSFC